MKAFNTNPPCSQSSVQNVDILLLKSHFLADTGSEAVLGLFLCKAREIAKLMIIKCIAITVLSKN